jgi:hypothetical protein
VVAIYDANGDGQISEREYRQAVWDYIAGKISYLEVAKVASAYQSSR